MLDDHQRCIRHINADLDDRGRDENVDAACYKLRHYRFLFRRFHTAVEQADAVLRKYGSPQLVIHRGRGL